MGHQQAVERLRALHEHYVAGQDDLAGIPAARDTVVERFARVFAPATLSDLSVDDFLAFLQSKQNRHWVGLHRQGPRIVRDMARLRQALSVLLDESRPIQARLDAIIPRSGVPMVPGLGKAVLTPILMIVHPDRYTVWNQTSEAAMRELGIWPAFKRGASFGDKYEEVNRLTLSVAKEIGVDSWVVDALWWRLLNPMGDPGPEPDVPDPDATGLQGQERFALERQLHDFLRDNWKQTPLGQDWELYTEVDDPEAGYEYQTGVGRIDLLAKHRTKPAWLVVELKLEQASDATVGQVLRYMSWIRRHLAAAGDSVQGLVVAGSPDERLRYALADQPDIGLKLYEISFRLKDSEPLPLSAEKRSPLGGR